MADKAKTAPPKPGEETGLDAPQLTRQGRTADGGEDETDPQGSAKKGQSDKAEGE